MGRRLADLEGRLSADCPGPPIEFYQGTRAELDALEMPDDCCLCGRPLAEHPGGRPYFIEVVRPAGRPAERNGDGG
jgi:hypothetical protein